VVGRSGWGSGLRHGEGRRYHQLEQCVDVIFELALRFVVTWI
jgi:hypothetical protein